MQVTLAKAEESMVYEVRFQTVEPKRRADYVKMYKEAIEGCKAAGCRSGLILCSEDEPAAVMVLLEWPTKEHHLNWRGTPTHKSFAAAVEGWQTKPSQGGYYIAETLQACRESFVRVDSRVHARNVRLRNAKE